MSRISKRIVIDASIARSAGKTDHPVSRACREFLNEVLKICHHAVMTPEIREEWKRNQSFFSANWLASMTARKKVFRTQGEVDDTVELNLKKSQLSERGKAAILKDLHLLEAALAADLAVASLDQMVRSQLRDFSDQWRQIRDIVWVNPAQPEDSALEWLASGALPEKERQLGFARDNSDFGELNNGESKERK